MGKVGCHLTLNEIATKFIMDIWKISERVVYNLRIYFPQVVFSIVEILYNAQILIARLGFVFTDLGCLSGRKSLLPSRGEFHRNSMIHSCSIKRRGSYVSFVWGSCSQATGCTHWVFDAKEPFTASPSLEFLVGDGRGSTLDKMKNNEER